jgi:hypothetical protein
MDHSLRVLLSKLKTIPLGTRHTNRYSWYDDNEQNEFLYTPHPEESATTSFEHDSNHVAYSPAGSDQISEEDSHDDSDDESDSETDSDRRWMDEEDDRQRMQHFRDNYEAEWDAREAFRAALAHAALQSPVIHKYTQHTRPLHQQNGRRRGQ